MKPSLILLAILLIITLVVVLPACDRAATPVVQAPSPAPSRPAPAPTATPRPSPTATATPISAATPTLTPYISPTSTSPSPPPSLPDPPERKALAQDVKLVAAWERSTDKYSANWDWSTQGLAFVHEGAIWVAQGPQFERRLVTSGPLPDSRLVNLIWSPDGKAIAFIAGGQLPLDERSLLVVQADGSSVPKVIDVGVDSIKDWADPSRLFYTVHIGSKNAPLYCVDMETGERKVVDQDGYVYYWSPNHSYIVVRQCCFFLRLRNQEGDDLGRVGDGSESAYVDDWTPDGKRFLFSQWWRVKDNAGNSDWDRPELWTWDVLQRRGQLVLRNAWGGDWSPDGQYVACWVAGTPIRDSEGHITGTEHTPGQLTPLNLGLVEVRTGRIKTLISVKSDVTSLPTWPDPHLFWLLDSAHLVYQGEQDTWWLLPMSTLQAHPLVSDQGHEDSFGQSFNRFGTLSPNGMYWTYQDLEENWWLLSMSTLQTRQLTKGLGNSTLIWSPDSRYLALITPARILILEP